MEKVTNETLTNGNKTLDINNFKHIIPELTLKNEKEERKNHRTHGLDLARVDLDMSLINALYQVNEKDQFSQSNNAFENSEDDIHLILEDKRKAVLNELSHKLDVNSTRSISSDENILPVETCLSKNSLKFFVYSLGIVVFYFVSGIYTEKLLKGSFGDQSEKFTFIFMYILIQNVVNYLFAAVLVCTVSKDDVDNTSKKYYALVAILACTSMFLGNKALKWISYPTQVIAKSVKPIPVMVFNVMFAKQNYAIKKYFFVFLVVCGVCLFSWNTSDDSSRGIFFSCGWGELCVVVSLVIDGLVGSLQERMRFEFQTKSGYFMKNINKWSVFFVGTAALISQEQTDFFNFISKYPSAVQYFILISLLGCFGQMCIYLVMSQFGSLPCTLVCTCRKFFTVLGSIIIFRHTMTHIQWIATFFVFMGLLLDSYYSKKEKL